MKILLLDDNLMSSMRVESNLRNGGHEVKLARRIAPELAEIEAVIVNVGSRSMKGLELLDEAQIQFPEAALYGFCGHREVDIWKAAQAKGAKMITNENAMSEISKIIAQ
jgi:DNA-binding NtrC family response regulator